MKRSFLILPLAVATTALFSVSTAKAENVTWVGTSTGSWSESSNWSTGALPVDGDIFVHSGEIKTGPDFETPVVFGGIISKSGALGAEGTTIHLAGNLTRENVTGANIVSTIELHANSTFTVEGGSSRILTLAGGASGGGTQSVTGDYGITKTGPGVLSFQGGSDFSGGLTVNGGLVYSRGGNENTTHFGTGTLTVATTGTVALFYNKGTTVHSLAGSGVITHKSDAAVGERRLTVNTAVENTFSGSILDVSETKFLSLTKSGTGSLTLSGNNAYTGTTLVNGGLLKVVGSLGATAVTVNNGGALGGAAGTIAGAVTVKDGGALSFTLADDGIKGLDLGSTLTLESGADLKLTLTGTVVDEYTLLSSTGALSGKFATVNGVAVGVDDFFILNRGGTDYNFQLLYGTNDLKVAYQAIPEASTYAMVGAGAAALFFFGARRRKEQA